MPVNLILISIACVISWLMHYYFFNSRIRLKTTGGRGASIPTSIIVLLFYAAVTIFVFAVPTAGSNTKSNIVFNAMYLLVTTCYALFSSSIFLRIARLNTPQRRILYIGGLTSSIVYAIALIILKSKYP